MATNKISIAAPADDVFDLLLDPRNCAYWVVGTKEIPSVDEAWPLRGSGFDARVGVGPLTISARTTLLRAERPHVIWFVTTAGPVPAAIEVSIAETGDGCTVEMREYVNDPIWRLVLGPAAEVGFKLRNIESLNRLRALAERHGAVETPSPRGALSGIDILGAPAVDAVTAGADHAYLTVDAKLGPHVTPELFAVHAGRLWIVTAASTVKAGAIERRPPVGVLLTSGDAAVVVRGEALVLDPLAPFGWAEAFQESAHVAGALLHYGSRNARTLLPTAVSLLSSLPTDVLGSRRVAVAVRPESAAVLRGDRVEQILGSWSDDNRTYAPQDAGTATADVAALPREFKDVVEERVRAVLAWETNSGPVPVPAFWDADRAEARIAPALVHTLPSRARIGLMLLADGRVADKAGVLLRGTGTLEDDGTATLELERAAYWSGSVASSTEL